MGTVALVAIVFAIINCLKKLGNEIPKYAPVATTDTTKVSSPNKSTDDFAVAVSPAFPVILDSQINTVTIERFLSNMAREKPIRFLPHQLSGFTRNYSMKLGSGGFGDVYKGEFPNGVQVAVKVLNNSISHKRVEEQFMSEVSTIGRTYHFNLVKLYGFCFEPTMRALVYEYMDNGSLDRFLFSENRTIECMKLKEIAIGTAKGIAYLHEECEQRIIHYDIKPGNVLLDANFSPKVADFGLAKLCNRGSTHVTMTGFRGTLGYAAPELSKRYKVTSKCDVYSYGMLLFEIIGRRRNYVDNQSESREWLPKWIWENMEKPELKEMMIPCGIEEEDQEDVKRMCMVALWCVQYLPDERPLMSTVVKMLEGGVELAPPPNPFQYLESSGLNLAAWTGSNVDSSYSTSNGQASAASTGSSVDSNGSTSKGQASELSSSTPNARTFEIEVAN